MLFEIYRGSKKVERDWTDLEGEPNVLSANDLFVPVAAAFAGLYFFVAGNFVVVLLAALAAIFAYNFWTSRSARDKQVAAPALRY